MGNIQPYRHVVCVAVETHLRCSIWRMCEVVAGGALQDKIPVHENLQFDLFSSPSFPMLGKYHLNIAVFAD